jgi:hypothetical protein
VIACDACGEDFHGTHHHYGVDVRTGHGVAYVMYAACCEAMQYIVESDGYEAAYGRSLIDVVAEITGCEVLDVVADGDGSVVCRLRIVDPTIPGKRDDLGRAACTSPKGWQAQVFADVADHHRHHEQPQGYKFGVAVYNGRVRVGVAVVGRPVSQKLQAAQPLALEVTRVVTFGERPLRMNASSKLYAAAADRAKSLGYTRMLTYTLADEESGASLVASGWVPTAITRGGSWDKPSRRRESKAPEGRKVRWERGLDKHSRREIEARRIVLSLIEPAVRS